MKPKASILLVVLLGAIGANGSQDAFETRCRGLRGRKLHLRGADRVEVVKAIVEAGDPNQSAVPVEHCRVQTETETVNPAEPMDRSTIQSLIRLPKTWNGRLFMGGSGGFGGDLGEEQIAGITALDGTALQRGFATVVNDTGHAGSRIDASWALEVPPSPGIDSQKERNFAGHSTHLSVMTAKKLAAAFYRSAVKYSYFHGCSTGGRQALVAATAFPRDFDGIIAGAPTLMAGAVFSRYALTQEARLAVSSQLTVPKLERVTSLVLAKCDADDGVADGILTDPRRCEFDAHQDLPACPGNVDGPDCFTAEQKEFIDFVHGQIQLENPPFIAHGLMPSSEGVAPGSSWLLQGWASWITGTPLLGNVNLQWLFDTGARQFMVFDDPDFEESTYLTTRSLAQIREDSRVLSSLDPPKTLDAFRGRGGKLLLYHGWIDPALAPEDTIHYVESVEEETPGDREQSVRLFMIPGMAHCGFGPGAQVFDGIDVIVDWVENSTPPDGMLAFSPDGQLSRPLCKYPTAAVYRGGDARLAGSFGCALSW